MHHLPFVTKRPTKASSMMGDITDANIPIPIGTKGIATAFKDVDWLPAPSVFAIIESLGNGMYCLPMSAIELVKE